MRQVGAGFFGQIAQRLGLFGFGAVHIDAARHQPRSQHGRTVAETVIGRDEDGPRPGQIHDAPLQPHQTLKILHRLVEIDHVIIGVAFEPQSVAGDDRGLPGLQPGHQPARRLGIAGVVFQPVSLGKHLGRQQHLDATAATDVQKAQGAPAGPAPWPRGARHGHGPGTATAAGECRCNSRDPRPRWPGRRGSPPGAAP
jgi:hypothetical protein